jgi:anti-sigma regulatory factor (Ser/Thr protein kinase)
MFEIPNTPVRMLIASSPAHLPVVRAALDCLCELMGFDDKCRGGIVLAVDEALTNVIRHAYHGALDKPIEVTMHAGNEDAAGGLKVELRDWGQPVPLEKIKSRALEDVRPGGLGVHIMTCFMDTVQFDPRPDGGTLLTMTKALPVRSGT